MDQDAHVRDTIVDPPVGEADAHVQSLADRFRAVRRQTLVLVAPLSAEDAAVQSMPDASPAKWHLAHTTWFFDRFVLQPLLGQASPRPQWDALFNSYYQSVGPMHPRPQRGLLSRPSLDDVVGYREVVDGRLGDAIAGGKLGDEALRAVELGLQHEQQHQELLLTDIKHALSLNPLLPAYGAQRPAPADAGPLEWIGFEDAIVGIGAAPWPASKDFAYDHESPRHRVLVGAFALAARPVTAGEYRDFIADGGYRTPGHWLADGWAWVQAGQRARPLYWLDDAHHFTLAGAQAIDPDAPVVHLNYYEADAYARWAGARLPTEHEWERAAAGQAVRGNFVETAQLQPRPCAGPGLRQLFGDVWEWTASAYAAYPGFRPMPGALGEYNGKFMCGQWVLRGGSCASPASHLRATYRNFFPPTAQWQFAGVRLARDIA
jgi:ergothioneine biosynthesis protein EgtB